MNTRDYDVSRAMVPTIVINGGRWKFRVIFRVIVQFTELKIDEVICNPHNMR